jgi:hypothetical protein
LRVAAWVRAGFAHCQTVSSALPSLIIATAELSVVRAITGAINANLPKTGPLGTIPPAANPHTPRPHPKFDAEPEPQIIAQPVYHVPTPRFDPRFVIHPAPKVEEVPSQYVTGPVPEASTAKSSNPIQPPWRTPLPWPEEERILIEPKVYPQVVDLIHKGTLLDLFV